MTKKSLKFRPSEWRFGYREQFSEHEELRKYRGTYRFTVLVTGDGVKPDGRKIDVTYDGQDYDAGRSFTFGGGPVRCFGGVLSAFRRARWKRSAMPGSSNKGARSQGQDADVNLCLPDDAASLLLARATFAVCTCYARSWSLAVTAAMTLRKGSYGR